MNDNETSWINIADIMSALMMIFMFISIAFLYQILTEKENNKVKIAKKIKPESNISKPLSKKEVYKLNLNRALHQEFDKDLYWWKAVITNSNIIRFNAPFELGEDIIPHNIQLILADFFPRYIKVLTQKEFKDEIEEIRVEGHTSNVWGDKSLKDSYMYNMRLSQKRASNVLEYCYYINDLIIENNIFWLRSNLRANGMSFSKLLYIDKAKTVPDQIRSRRVEFRVVTKEQLQNNIILNRDNLF
jgi:outer membrane protein OmpA-like peptidoglycan-associated protein